MPTRNLNKFWKKLSSKRQSSSKYYNFNWLCLGNVFFDEHCRPDGLETERREDFKKGVLAERKKSS